MAQATKMRTRTISGHRLTLLRGVRYLAHRPMAPAPGTRITVTLEPIDSPPPEAQAVRIPGFTYAEANRFLGAFNNGRISFDGRVW
jgi:hypothetical protein